MMDNSVSMGMIAFMDDDATNTREEYLFELCKIALYRNGFAGLTIVDLLKEIQKIIPFEYTEEEIAKVLESKIDDSVNYDIENGKYSLRSSESKEYEKRDKSFPLRKYVDDYCDKFVNNAEKGYREFTCNLITKFIFDKFQESTSQILSIIDGNTKQEFLDASVYTDEERDFINGFLIWPNTEKNRMIYNLIVKSYDFWRINCPNKIAFNFSDFRFYLDANIVMRLMGINNEQRKDAMERFIAKCRQNNIKLIVSNFTKAEISNSIDYQLLEIEKELAPLGTYIPSPNSETFGQAKELNIDMYSLFYDYYQKKKNRSLNGFRTALNKELDNIIAQFEYEEEVSFETLSPEKFNKYSFSLSSFKNEAVVSTDVNNIILLQRRRESHNDSYMISADGKLINWCKRTFVGASSLVNFPSVWLSIIMNFTGRATEEEYAAFCKFIRLPIVPKEIDLHKKAEIKKEVSSMDIPDQMKDQVLNEINHNYLNYREFDTPSEIAEKAREKIYKDFEENIRKEERDKYEKRISEERIAHETEINERNILDDEKNRLHEEQLSASRESLERAIKDGEMKSVEYQINARVQLAVDKRENAAKNLSRIKYRIIAGFAIFLIIVCVVCDYNKWFDFSFGIAVAAFIIEFIVIVIINDVIERWGNRDLNKEKFEKKYRKKYKDLLK